ncbi:dihydrouridine synthase [Candidatus Marinamargulisbacteria bacterium SCGC AG-343-D04]|nr:dihydrouridine synthase [Candidatus Marinamargulisbacteria bacterium SCGC AG-343-D04]
MTHKSFWKELKKPIIGLAPMDGYSDSAFRRICKEINPEIVTVTEFTSADGLSFGAERLRKKLSFHPSEQPVFAQIFGKNTETFITATKLCEDMGFSGIDINMGCPSKRVVKSEHGVALRKKPDLAFKLIESVAQNTSLPVSVKTRLGLKNADDLTDFAIGAQNAGANMLCVHARTYAEPYNVPAQHNYLYDLKHHIDIPLIINGGITSYQDGMEKCQNCDGFYIGQASFGNPWTFSPHDAPKTIQEKLPIILKHSQYLIEDKGELVGTREIRKHLLQYVKGFYGAKQFRSQLVHVKCYQDIVKVFDDIIEHESSLKSASLSAISA